jgi:hypothetical protein
VYTPAALRHKIASGNDFVKRVLEQPKIFVLGSEDELRPARKTRGRKAAQG